MLRYAAVLVIGSACLAAGTPAGVSFWRGLEQPPACTAAHLLEGGGTWQQYSADLAWSWPERFDFTCHCPYFKARYACTPKPPRKRKVLVPNAVANGTCTYLPADQLAANPLPPHSSVMFMGNSHMRQVVESILCMFPGAITSRRSYYKTPAYTDAAGEYVKGGYANWTLEVDEQCRDCSNPEGLANLESVCPGVDSEEWNCNCKDDWLEVRFSNGATLRYGFLGSRVHKSLEGVAQRFDVPLDSVDAVFVNQGNAPHLPVDEFLDEMEHAFQGRDRQGGRRSPPLWVWASTYFSDRDDIHTQVHNLGFRPTDAEILRRLRRQNVSLLLDTHSIMWSQVSERVREGDAHYCMPGPPNDLSLLVLHAIGANLVGLRPPAEALAANPDASGTGHA